MSSFLGNGVEIASILYRSYMRISTTRGSSDLLPNIVRMGMAANRAMERTKREWESGAWTRQVREAGVLVNKGQDVDEWLHWLAYSEASYACSKAEVSQVCGVPEADIIVCKLESARTEPSYFIALDRVRKALVLVVRGTRSASDVMTDLSIKTAPFLDGIGHEGVVQSALFIRDSDEVRALLSRFGNEGFCVVTVGHSLGGAIAGALALYLKDLELPQGKRVQTKSYLFCPPPFVGEGLASRLVDAPIRTLVHGFDVVPRLSVASFERAMSLLAPPRPLSVGSTGSQAWDLVTGAIQFVSILTYGARDLPRLAHQRCQYPELRIPGEIFYLFEEKGHSPYSHREMLRHVPYKHFEDVIFCDRMLYDHSIESIRASLLGWAER